METKPWDIGVVARVARNEYQVVFKCGGRDYQIEGARAYPPTLRSQRLSQFGATASYFL